MWEDEKNKQGGRWLVNSNRSQRTDLDQIWLETVRMNSLHVRLNFDLKWNKKQNLSAHLKKAL